MKKGNHKHLLLAILLLAATWLAAQTVTGRAWNDLNNNAQQDAGEMGLGSVWVQVETPSGQWVTGGFTAMNGTYSYLLAAGNYVVKIANPGNGFNGVQPNMGSDATDSDVSIYGFSDPFSLAAGQTVDIDGGLTTGGQCYTPVMATASAAVCTAGGFSFQITATGGTSFGGQSWGWDYAAGGLSMQPYGQGVTVGPFPCSGTATVTIKDVDNPFCAATLTVSAPACCGAPVLPTLSINDVTVNEPAGTATLQICASSASASPVLVQFSTSNGSALSGSDFSTTSGTATIAAGQTCTTITIPISDDAVAEPTEVFNVNLSSPSGATIADPLGTVTILDNDSAGQPDCNAITITPNGSSITISGLNAPIISIQAFNSSWATVFTQTYTTSPGTVTIPGLAAGQYFVKVDFLTAQYAAICKKEGYFTVGGAPVLPTLSINDITVNESAGTASLQICASSASTSPILVNYSTSNGSAVAGSDYSTTSATATIAAGQTCTTVTFPILNDQNPEPTESFNVNLSSPTGATIADPLGTVTILDNDAAPTPTLSINDITVNEEARTASLQICLSAASAAAVSVNFSTSNGSAVAGSDYSTTSATATIAAGQTCTTVTFPILNDQNPEPMELFNVNLTSPTGATIADPLGTVTILDTDQGGGTPDCNNISITVSGSNIVITGITAPISIVQAFNAVWSPVFNQNYTTPPGTVTIPGLAAGTYFVKVDFLTANWAPICNKEGYFTVGGAPVLPTLSINDITVNEEAGTASLQICASAASASPISVQYSTSNGSAVAGSDYSNLSATATIPAGQTCTTVTFPILNDQNPEPTELFNVNLSNPTGATIADPLGTVTILDGDQNTNLTITCPVNMNITASTGANSAIVTYPTPTASTTCAGGAVTILRTSGPASGSAFPIGTTTVCHQATDNCGNQKSCCFTVTVNAPTATDVTITCPVNMNITASTGANSAIVTYPTPTASTTCAGGAVTILRTSGPASGSAFPIGTTTVCHQATDNCGNQKSCCFTVTVNPPAAGCDVKSDQCMTVALESITQQSSGQKILRFKVTNNCAMGLSNIAFQLPSTSMAIVSGNYTSPNGRSYMVENPTSNPFYSVKFNATGQGIANGQMDIFEFGLDAGVAIPPSMTVQVKAGTPTYTVVLNTAGCMQTPSVVTINCAANVSAFAPVGSTTANVLYAMPTAATTCFDENIDIVRTSGPASGAAFPIGTTAVCFRATDACGNSKTCCFNVVVGPCTVPANTICFVSPTKPNLVSAQIKTTDNGSTVTFRTTFARTFVDNTYGTGAIGWNSGHTFSNLTGSDNLQLALFNGAGTKVLEFKQDYVSASSAAPSGFKSLGVTGGEGQMIVGSAANVVAATSSIDVNLNQFGYVLTTNSPATTATYTPNPSFPNWIFDVWYEVTVNKSVFGTSGVGTPMITSVHASPSKTGSNTEPVGVTPCTPTDPGCVTTPPPPTVTNCCQGSKIKELRITYTGANCTATNNTQGGKATCAGDANNAASVRIVVSEKSGSTGKIWFDGLVSLNSKFTALASNGGASQLSSDSHVQIFSPSGTLLQTLKIHTSCSQAIASGNQFGALRLEGIRFVDNTTCGNLAAALNQDALTFNAQRVGSVSKLIWVNTTGEWNEFFDVERSANGLSGWQKMARVDGKGPADEVLYFEEIDRQPLIGDNFYRLKWVVKTGQAFYSDVQKVHFEAVGQIAVFPNPANDALFVDLSSMEGKTIDLALFNAFGQQILFEKVNRADFDAHRIDLEGLPSGQYFLRIQADGQRAETLKIAVTRL